jgi:hypothetical protein
MIFFSLTYNSHNFRKQTVLITFILNNLKSLQNIIFWIKINFFYKMLKLNSDMAIYS